MRTSILAVLAIAGTGLLAGVRIIARGTVASGQDR